MRNFDAGGEIEAAYLAWLDSGAKPLQIIRCSGRSGKCRQEVGRIVQTPKGDLVTIRKPGSGPNPELLNELRRDHGRRKAPFGIAMVGEFRNQIQDETGVSWCPDHLHRTINLRQMLDISDNIV
tara:strand:- start:398 stop:769 length:372 start_codon:yes stop_codon:yes gene_type:complete